MGINQFDSKNPRLDPTGTSPFLAEEESKRVSSSSHAYHQLFLVLFVSLFLVSRFPQISSLKINPKPCSNAIGEEGTCMFVWECIKTEGKHLGTCVDGFLFGSCCGHNDTSNDIDEAISSISADKPVPASSSDVTSPSPPSSSWFNPSSSSSSSSTSSSQSSSSFQTNPWQSYPPAQVSSSSSSHHTSSWPTQRPTSFPYGQTSSTSSNNYPNRIPPPPPSQSPTTISPSHHQQQQQPSTPKPTPPNVPTTNIPPTPHPSPTPSQQQHPPPPSVAQESGPPNPWSSVSSLVQGPAQVSVQPQRPSTAVTPATVPTTLHTFRPPIFSIFGTHRPPPGTMFFKPPRPTRPTFRPPVIMPVRPTTSIFQPFNPRPSPAPFPQFPSSHHTTPAALTSTAISTTVPSTTTVPTTSTTTTTEPTSTTAAPYFRPTPFRPNYPQITNNPGTTSSQISSGSNSIVTRKPPSHSGKFECGTPPLLPQSKVVGGKNSAFGSWPWQVSVRRTSFFGFSSTHRCGGAIINSQWIATAGHCVDDLLLSQIRIRVGEYDFASAMEPYPFMERGAKRKVVHPNYNFFTYENDLALVQLDEPLDFQPHISPICLPPDNIELVGRNATVTGWGRLSEGGVLPSVLQEVKVPIVSNDKCKGMFLNAGRHEYIPEIFMCAGYPEGGRDSCQGDSGGPLQVQGDDGKWFLAGIISWGIGCAEPNLPGVCTRISKFKNWIVNTVNS